MAIWFMWLINTWYYHPPLKLQLKAVGVLFGGMLLAWPLYLLIAEIPAGDFLTFVLNYLLLLLASCWLIMVQEEMGAQE